ALCDFVLQALVGALERGRALPDPRLELAVGAAQRLLALAQRVLDRYPLGDIDRMAEHVGGALPVVRQDVAVHPDPRFPTARNHAHQAGVLAVLRDPIEVVVEQIAGVGRQEIAQVLADAVTRLVAERAGSRETLCTAVRSIAAASAAWRRGASTRSRRDRAARRP